MNKKSLVMIGVLVILMLVGLVGWSQSRAEREMAIGYVDLEQVSREWVRLKEIKQNLEQEVAKLQKEYDEKSAKLSQEEKVKLYQQYQASLESKQAAMMKEAEETVAKTVQEVAKSQGLAVVLNKQMVLFGGKDITPEVLQRLNAGVKK